MSTPVKATREAYETIHEGPGHERRFSRELAAEAKDNVKVVILNQAYDKACDKVAATPSEAMQATKASDVST